MDQVEWLKESISASQATWKVVFGHYQYATDGYKGDGDTMTGIAYGVDPGDPTKPKELFIRAVTLEGLGWTDEGGASKRWAGPLGDVLDAAVGA